MGLFVELISRDIGLLRVARGFAPDIIVSNNSPCGAHVAWLLRRPSLVFDDTEIHRLNRLLYRPVVSEVHAPDCFRAAPRRREHRYAGFHALAYLHPDHFRPDPEIAERVGISAGERVVVLRFVAWGALHDVGLGGLSPGEKLALVHALERHARVLVSSEEPLDAALEPYRLSLPLAAMHDLLAHADLVIGESATMCAEAAVLGTPAIYIDEKGRGYTDELESRYGLCFNSRPGDYAAIEAKALELIALENTRAAFAPARERLLGDKIDVSAYQLEQIDRLAARGR